MPCAPATITVEPTEDATSVLVRWTPPRNLNPSLARNMAGYVLEKLNRGEEEWRLLARLPCSVLECEVGDLVKGKEYFLRVAAELKDSTVGPSRELCEPFKFDAASNTFVGCECHFYRCNKVRRLIDYVSDKLNAFNFSSYNVTL